MSTTDGRATSKVSDDPPFQSLKPLIEPPLLGPVALAAFRERPPSGPSRASSLPLSSTCREGGLGKRGPKQIPTVLKELHGNPGKRRLPENEPEGVGDLWAPPAYMDEEQRAQWNYGVDHAPPGLLTGTDRDIFGAWVCACVEYRKAVLEVRKIGQVVKTKDGNAIQNPFLGIMNRQAVLMNRLGAELGFSPAARASLGSAAPAFGDGPGRRIRGESELDRYLAIKPDVLDS